MAPTPRMPGMLPGEAGVPPELPTANTGNTPICFMRSITGTNSLQTPSRPKDMETICTFCSSTQFKPPSTWAKVP